MLKILVANSKRLLSTALANNTHLPSTEHASVIVEEMLDKALIFEPLSHSVEEEEDKNMDNSRGTSFREGQYKKYFFAQKLLVSKLINSNSNQPGNRFLFKFYFKFYIFRTP